MRIGIMGDTHGDFGAMDRILRQAGEVDLWLHTGDYSQDVAHLRSLTNKSVQSVCGNCDSYEGRSPKEAILHLEGFTLALVHGHQYLLPDSLANLAFWGRSKNAQVVIFGHTHVALTEMVEDVLLVNPGSPSRPRRGLPSYAELYLLRGEKPVANICYLD